MGTPCGTPRYTDGRDLSMWWLLKSLKHYQTSQIQCNAYNNEELSKHIAISTDKTICFQIFQPLNKWLWRTCRDDWLIESECKITRRRQGKSANTKLPVFMYNLNGTLESFPMLQCPNLIFLHDLTHHQHNSSQYNHTTSSDVPTPQTTYLSY